MDINNIITTIVIALKAAGMTYVDKNTMHSLRTEQDKSSAQ